MKSRKVLLVTLIIFLMSTFKITAFAAEDVSGYVAADIAAINNIIETNGLQGYEKDSPSTWDFVKFWKTDTSGKKYIFNLNLDKKELTGTLDVSGLSGLTYLKCEKNNLTGLNVSGLTKIESIQCSQNMISSLDVTGLTTLDTLQCSYNSLEMLDVSGLTNLEDFRCFENNDLTKIEGLQDCTSLELFSCGSCKLEKLDVTPLTNLKELNCDSMNMTELIGLTDKANLGRINCSGNKLEQLDVSGCVNLNTVFCNHNNLSEIKGLKDCTALATFRCHKNNLKALDLSSFPDSCNLKMDNNNLTEVALKNGTLKIGSSANGTAYITDIQLDESKVSLATSPNTGYIFDGWYTDAATTEEKIDFDGIVSSDMTLYPKFSPIISNVIVSELPASITYGDSLELAVTGIEVASGYDAEDAKYRWYEGENDFETDASSLTYAVNDTSEHTISCDITLDGYKVTKTFTFTASPKTINTAISLTAPVRRATPQTSIDTDEYTATVVWSPVVSSVFAQNTAYTATITITPKENYTTNGIAKNGYTLDGATTVENEENSNVVTAVFPKTARSYNGGTSNNNNGSTYYIVSFETNGGSNVSSQVVERNSVVEKPADPTKENLNFSGWYTDKELKNKFDFSTKISNNLTLYAGWTKEDNLTNQIILTIGEKVANVFGSTKTNDVAPKIVKDRAMLPARFVAESLGANVTWDGEKGLVTIKGKNLETGEDVTILITIGAEKAVVNGKEVKLDSPAFIENDRTYTPIRFISEKLGASVEWLEKEQKIVITRPEIEKQDKNK